MRGTAQQKRRGNTIGTYSVICALLGGVFAIVEQRQRVAAARSRPITDELGLAPIHLQLEAMAGLRGGGARGRRGRRGAGWGWGEDGW